MFKTSPFSIVASDMTLAEILQHGPTVLRVLRRLGFPDCSNCSVRFDETLEEAVLNYGLYLEKVLMTLNATIVKERIIASKLQRRRGTA